MNDGIYFALSKYTLDSNSNFSIIEIQIADYLLILINLYFIIIIIIVLG